MSLQFTRATFVLCPSCAAKPGSPSLCAECLERRELWGVVDRIRSEPAEHGVILVKPRWVKLCRICLGVPRADCPEHGR